AIYAETKEAIANVTIKIIEKAYFIVIISTIKVVIHTLVKFAIYKIKKQISTDTIPINFLLIYINMILVKNRKNTTLVSK
ncbi:hypothetical protein BU108_13480, partial [Staphylococcus xylosus]